jgi:hypothetical protein
MIRTILFVTFLGLAFTSRTSAQAPQRAPISPQEYIQSVSPLASGGTVISRSTPGQGVQTVTTIANLPSVSSPNPSAVVGYQPHTSYAGQWNTNPTQTSPKVNGYVYPASTSAFLTQRPTNTLGLEPIGSRAFQQTRLFQRAPANQYAQNCPTCVGGAAPGSPVQVYSPMQSAGGTVVNPPPAALTAPTLTAPQPVQLPATGLNPGMQYNLDPTWNSSFTTNPSRSTYSPILALRNLPPGTYVGQGILGQPKAYVDGEPIRNFLRYFSY